MPTLSKLHLLIPILLASTSVAAVAANAITFEDAAAKAVNVKGCDKKMIDRIATAKISVDPHLGKKGAFLEVCDEACASARLIGPLSSKPSADQPARLIGKPMCLSAD